MSIPELGGSNVQVITRPHKALAAGEGLLRHSVPGETLLYKVTGDDTDGALDIFLLSIHPKSGPPLHIHHQQHETIYFTRGRYKVQIDDDVFRCDAGGFVHIPMGARHAFMNVSDHPGECIKTFFAGRHGQVLRRICSDRARRASGPGEDRAHFCQARMGAGGSSAVGRLTE